MYLISILFIVNLATNTVKCYNKTINYNGNSTGLQEGGHLFDNNTDSLNPALNPIFNFINKTKTKRDDKNQIDQLDVFEKAPYNDNSQSTSQEKLVKEKSRATKQFKVSFAPSFLSKEYEEQEETQQSLKANSKEKSTVTYDDQTIVLASEDTETSDSSSALNDEDDYQNNSFVNKLYNNSLSGIGFQEYNEQPDSSSSEDAEIDQEKEDKNIQLFKKATKHKKNKKWNNNLFKIVKEKNTNILNEDQKHDSQDTVSVRDEILKYIKHFMKKHKERKEHKHQTRHSRKRSESKSQKQQHKKITKKGVNNTMSIKTVTKKNIKLKKKTQKNNKLHNTKSTNKKNNVTNNKIEQKEDNLVQKIKSNLTPLIKALINEERKTENKLDLPKNKEENVITNAEGREESNLQHYSDLEKATNQPNIFENINENEVDFPNNQIGEIPPSFQQTYTDEQNINNFNQNDENLLQVQNAPQTVNDDNDINMEGLDKYDDEPMGVILPSIGNEDEEMTSVTTATTEHNSSTKKELGGKFHKFIGKIRKGLREKLNKILGGT